MNVISIAVGADEGLTKSVWEDLHVDGVVSNDEEVYRLVYYGGVEPALRKEVWPYLLGHYTFGSTPDERSELDQNTHNYYETTMSEWLAVEAIVRQRDKEKTAHAVAKLSSESCSGDKVKGVPMDCEMENDVFETNGISDISDAEGYDDNENESRGKTKVAEEAPVVSTSGSVEKMDIEGTEKDEHEKKEGVGSGTNESSPTSSYATVGNDFIDPDIGLIPSPLEGTLCHAVIVTKASIDIGSGQEVAQAALKTPDMDQLSPLAEETAPTSGNNTSLDALQEPKSNCVSPASSNGGVYSVRMLL